MADSSNQQTPMYERLIVGSPVGDFELLFCHVISLQDQVCGDMILTTAKSSIYSTKSPIAANNNPSVHFYLRQIDLKK